MFSLGRFVSRAATSSTIRRFSSPAVHATTILTVKKDKQIVMIGDGQISYGSTVFKNSAVKIKELSQGNVLCGFAGSLADCIALVQLLEKEFEEYPNQTVRVCLNLARKWRTDKIHRHLSCDLLVADNQSNILLLDGNGNAIQIEDGVVAVGSGGLYALSAARALLDVEGMDAMDIAKKSMKIAAELCVFTNHNYVIRELKCE